MTAGVAGWAGISVQLPKHTIRRTGAGAALIRNGDNSRLRAAGVMFCEDPGTTAQFPKSGFSGEKTAITPDGNVIRGSGANKNVLGRSKFLLPRSRKVLRVRRQPGPFAS